MIEKKHEAEAEAALYMIHAYVEPHENTNPEMIKNINSCLFMFCCFVGVGIGRTTKATHRSRCNHREIKRKLTAPPKGRRKGRTTTAYKQSKIPDFSNLLLKI